MKKKVVRVLIVDDDPDYCHLVAQFLAKWGFSPRAITDDRRALVEFTALRPHIVLLDVRLPSLDCLSLLAEMLASDPKVAVILISAHKDEAMAKKALRLGACDYITKPFDPDELKRVLEWQVSGIE